MPNIPAVIGRYQIRDRIGHGGMGSLYLAWDPLLERQIAIKLLRDDNEELRERFAREARAVARLRHRNVVTIFDVGEQDGQPFIAMEYIQGRTLAELIRTAEPLTVARKLELLDELCDGLGSAHKIGIVHRDVKPANLMVEQDGVLKILDFGIARIAESGMTQAGMLIGTLNYMSPEQVAGMVVDNRSDIFAVGAVMYELLTLRQAFPGGLHNGILNRILHGEPEPLQALWPELGDDVIHIVQRALAKDPQERYQDMPEMRKDLLRVRHRLEASAPDLIAPPLDAETIVLQGPGVVDRSPQMPRRATDREELGRRRAAQIAAHLESAHRALAAEDFEASVAAAEHALMLDPEEPDALRIVDQAKAALEERQLQELLRRGQDSLQTGAVTQALALAQEALTLVPSSVAALNFQQSVEQALEERERERSRTAAIDAAMERARTSLASQAFDQAEAAAADALRLDPDPATASTLRQLQAAAVDGRAAVTAKEAEHLFDTGSPGAALELLDEFQPAHDRIAATRSRLQERQARLERERREAQVRAAAAVAAADRQSSHEKAIRLLEGALAIDPANAEIGQRLEQRRALWEDELQLARERRKKIAAAITRANDSISHLEAIDVLEAARALDPSDEEIARLLASRRARLAREEEAAQRLRERDAAIAAALATAEAMDDHRAAIQVLRRALSLDEHHVVLREQLAARERARDKEEAEARQARERAGKVARMLAAAEQEPSHEAAIAVLEDALKLDSSNAEIGRRLEQRRGAWQEEVRRARELRERIAASLAEANALPSHLEAIRVLEAAQALDPQDGEVRRSLSERRAAHEREQKEARQARDREAAIAAALATAAATDSHESAVDILERALTLDRAHPEMQQQLAVRRAARDQAREEARRERERHEQIVSALNRAKHAPSDEHAVAILKEAQALDPSHQQLRDALAAREAALERTRAEAKRLQDIGIARQRILDLIAEGQLDEASIALGEAEGALSAKKPLRDVARRLSRARAAVKVKPGLASERAEGTVQPGIPSALRDTRTRTLAYVAASVLAVVTLTAGYLISGRSSAGDIVTQEPPTTMAGPPVSPAPTNPVTNDEVQPPAASPPDAGTAHPPDAARAAGAERVDPQAAAAAAAVDLGRQQLSRGELRQALSTVSGGLKGSPQNSELRTLAAGIAARARQQAADARTAAARFGDQAAGLGVFREGQAKITQADRFERAGAHERAALSLWEAVDLFARAEREAGEAQARAAASQSARPAPAPPVSAADAARLPPEATKPAAPPPVTPPVPAPTVPVASASPAVASASNENAIRATLRAYADAYTALDVEAVKRVFPGVDEAALTRGFRDLTAQEVRIESEQISMTGDTATVTCQVRQSFTPRAGVGRSAVIRSVFRLQKTGDRWVILERR